MDFTTGLGLMIAPALTLRAMGTPLPVPEALPFVRFVGIFVCAVGANYLWGAARPESRLRLVLTSTVFFRFGVGTFVATAVLTGILPRAWATVAIVDLFLAVAQCWILSRQL
jgi:hypothetical protein